MQNVLSSTLLMLLLIGAVPSQASVTITVNSNGGSPYADSSGSALSTTSVVRVGYFDVSAPGSLLTLQTSNDFNAVNSLFRPLGEGQVGGGTINQVGSLTNYLVVNGQFSPGALFGQITGIDASYITPGSDLSVWIFNGSDPSSAAEWGIFSATTRPLANWDFPNDLGSSTLSTSEIDNVIRGFDSSTQFQLSSVIAVPEPSGLLLLLITGFCLIRRRRH